MRAMYGLVVFLHVLGAFVFVIAHGSSMLAAFRLRGETDRQRIAAILDLSSAGIGLMYVGLLVLLLAGVLAGFMGDHWGRGWIWAALGTLVVVIAAMYLLATPFYKRMRAAAGAQVPEQVAARLEPPATPEDLALLATSNRPMLLAAIGGLGLAVILWLMVMKPF